MTSLDDIRTTLRDESSSNLATRARWLRDSPDPVVRECAAVLESHLYERERILDTLASALFIYNERTTL